MMKWRAIVGAVVLVAAFVVLHIFFFSSRISQWNQLDANARKNVDDYKNIVGNTPLNTFNETALSGWLRNKEKEIARTKESFDKIRTNFPLVILPLSDEGDFAMTLFSETVKRVDALADFEKRYKATPGDANSFDRVSVLDDLDVRSTMVPGAVGMGYASRLLHYPTYALPCYYEKNAGQFPKQGAIEFWFKPDDWSTPEDRHFRTFFYARGPDRLRSSMLGVAGPANTYRPEIHIYKDQVNLLHFEMTDIEGSNWKAQPGALDQTNGFSPKNASFVSCVWSGNTLRMFLNGQEITSRQPLFSPTTGLMPGAEAMPGMGVYSIRDRLRGTMGYFGGGMEGLGLPGTQTAAPVPPSQFRGPEEMRFATLGLGGPQRDPFQNQADGVFDEFRIKNIGQPTPPTTARQAGAQIPGTMLLDSFESELVGKAELEWLINRIQDNLRFIRTTNDPEAQRPYIEEMEQLRACCGMATDRLFFLSSCVAYIRRVHIFREISEITGRSLNELFRTFCWLPAKEVRAPVYEIPQPSRDDMETFVGFLQLSLELLEDAMRDNVRIDRVTGMSLEGEDLFPEYTQLEMVFEQRLKELTNDPMLKPFVKGLQFVNPPQEWFDTLPDQAMQDPKIMQILMPVYDATAMNSMGTLGMPIIDPEAQEKQYKETERLMNKWVADKQADVQRLEKYLEAKRKRMIPPKIREEVRLAELLKGHVTYKKRSVRLNFECNATALSRFVYAVEYGNNGRLANIESYDIAADPNANLTVSLVVDFHQVSDTNRGPAARPAAPGSPGAPVAAVAPAGGPMPAPVNPQ